MCLTSTGGGGRRADPTTGGHDDGGVGDVPVAIGLLELYLLQRSHHLYWSGHVYILAGRAN